MCFPTFISFLGIYVFSFCEYVHVLSTCMCVGCVPGTFGTQNIPCNCRYTHLWATIQALLTKLEPVLKTTITPNNWAISLPPLFYFLFSRFIYSFSMVFLAIFTQIKCIYSYFNHELYCLSFTLARICQLYWLIYWREETPWPRHLRKENT